MRFPRVLLPSIFPLLALMLAVLTPRPAWGLAAPPECRISGPEKAVCSAVLCGPDGVAGYIWTFRGREFPGGRTKCITVTESGAYTLFVLDENGAKVAICTHDIFIEKCGANRPPDCSQARAKDAVLWPPNHEMDRVVIEGVKDPDGDPVSIIVLGITQDEPLDANGDGSTCADAEIVDDQAFVRRERTGDVNNPGNGRVYRIRFVAVDNRKLSCKGEVTVCVPHDMGQGDTCIDDGQLYDSMGDCEPPGQ